MKKGSLKVWLFGLLFIYLYTGLCKTYAGNTVIVTGGAGFIGSHVSQALLQRGDTVIIIDNINDAYDQRLKRYNLSVVKQSAHDSNLFIYENDIRDYSAMEIIFEKHNPDRICHLAARAGIRMSLEIPEEYITTNIIGTLNIFKLAYKYGIFHLVYASSSSVYGNCGEGPFTENFDISHPVSPYAMTKCANELLAYTYHFVYNIGSTGLRFFTVYGPRGRVDMVPFLFMDAMSTNARVRIFGDGSSQRDFTYVDDIVQGIIQALDKPQGCQVINLGRGTPIALQDFVTIMERVVGKKALTQREPMPVTDVLLTHAQINKARTLLGYYPQVSVEEGLKKMYRWYINEYVPMMSNDK